MALDRMLRKLAFLITIGMLLYLPWRFPQEDGVIKYDYVWVFDYLLKPGDVHWEKLAVQVVVTWTLALFIPIGLRWFDRKQHKPKRY